MRFDNDFWGSGGRALQLGERFDYDDIVTINWIGGFLQGRYEEGPLSSFAVAGYSRIKYTFEDFFTDDGNGRPFATSPSPIGGYQVKGGANYRLNEVFSVFASIGRVSKVPVFDGVIDAISGSINPDPQNESFMGVETGVKFSIFGQKGYSKVESLSYSME